MLAPLTHNTPPAKVSHKEWGLALLVGLLLVGLTAVPYLLATTTAQPGTVFTGTLMNPEDSQTYFAKMLQGYDGRWLYTIVFTAEPHEPAFLGGFYLFLGHLARWMGLTLTAVWHLARAVSVLLLALAVYGFVAYFVADRRVRLTAFLTAVFGAGLGWLLFLLNQPYWLDTFPVDFKMPEAHLFFTSLTFPHIILSTALLLASFWALLQALAHQDRRRGWLFAILASLINLSLSILHPLLVYLIVLTGSLYWLFLTIRARRILWREGFLLVVALVLPGLLNLYYGYSLLTNEVLRGWDAQRETTVSPPWPHWLMAYGPLLLFGGIHVYHQWRAGEKMSARWLFLWTWVLAAALLVYAPLSSQRRFVQGVHVPLSILAAAGFVEVILPWLWQTRPFRAILTHDRYSELGLTRFFIALFLLGISLSNLYVYASVSVSAVIQQPDLLFRPVDEVTAVQWLREHGRRTAVVLADYQSGNYVAAHAGNQVVLGHWAETIDYEGKTAVVAQFYNADTPDSWRRELLQNEAIGYVWHGPREQALGTFDPQNADYLHPIHTQGAITIYQVDK
ncbi:MAG: hypothetical protein IPM39_05840 [Chloroflexi bacterium]|nr:hypothetical protein [Chloroflexota bacterium]